MRSPAGTDREKTETRLGNPVSLFALLDKRAGLLGLEVLE
jgi:hypothetical protein